MNIEVLLPSNLSSADLSIWERMLYSNDDLQSPFFHPLYYQVLEPHAPNIRISRIIENGSIVGFLPFYLVSGIGKRVPLTDYQGLICHKDSQMSLIELVRKSGLRAWDFDHLPKHQTHFEKYSHSFSASPIIELDGSYFEYIELKRSQGRNSIIKRYQSKLRKIEREYGSLEFREHENCKQILDTLLDWREQKFVTRYNRLFFKDVISSFLNVKNSDFKPMLSTLYAGDKLIAAHFGLQTKHVWHWWMPSYNCEFATFSPGILHLLKLIECAFSKGNKYVDLGKGSQEYKCHLMTSEIEIAEGSVEVSSVINVRRKAYRKLKKLKSLLSKTNFSSKN